MIIERGLRLRSAMQLNIPLYIVLRVLAQSLQSDWEIRATDRLSLLAASRLIKLDS